MKKILITIILICSSSLVVISQHFSENNNILTFEKGEEVQYYPDYADTETIVVYTQHSTVSNEILNYQKLKSLEIHYLEVTGGISLPDSINKLERLEELLVRGGLVKLPKGLTRLNSFKSLKVSDQLIEPFEMSFFNDTDMDVLYLEHCTLNPSSKRLNFKINSLTLLVNNKLTSDMLQLNNETNVIDLSLRAKSFGKRVLSSIANCSNRYLFLASVKQSKITNDLIVEFIKNTSQSIKLLNFKADSLILENIINVNLETIEIIRLNAKKVVLKECKLPNLRDLNLKYCANDIRICSEFNLESLSLSNNKLKSIELDNRLTLNGFINLERNRLKEADFSMIKGQFDMVNLCSNRLRKFKLPSYFSGTIKFYPKKLKQDISMYNEYQCSKFESRFFKISNCLCLSI